MKDGVLDTPQLPVFEQSPFSMVLYDLEGRPSKTNAAFERLFGLSMDMVPPDYSVLIDPELERQGALPLVRRAFQGEAVRVGPIEYDAPRVIGRGKVTWTYGYFFPLHGRDGRMTNVALVHFDLTEQIQTERRLRLANERYRALVNAISRMVWNTNAEGTSDDLSGWRELTGQTPDEASGEGWANALHVDDRERARKVWGAAYESRSLYSNEYRLRMKDGSYRWMRARGVPILNDASEIVEWVGTLDDIHDERVAEENKLFLDDATRLLQTLEWERVLTALARHCVPYLADYASVDMLAPDGSIRRVETAHVDPEKEAIVRELWNRYPYEGDEPYGVPQVLRDGRPQFVPEFPWQQAVNFARDPEHLAMLERLRPRSFIGVPLRARGMVIGALSLVFSDSGRRYTDTELDLAMELASRAASAVDNARLYQTAENANRAKSEFLAVMSHELRTPLNGIDGHASLLEMGLHGELNAEQLEAVQRIRRNQRHLLALVNDVLNFARIEAGRVHYDIGAVDVDSVVAEAEAAVRPQLRARRLDYGYEPRSRGLQVLADRDKLLQILLNLLANAVKFTEPGGAITVGVAPAEDFVRVDVADTGVGIPRDKLDVIFDPFVQLDRTLSKSQGGAGLGLSISRDLARAMKGDIAASSTPGAGSTFVLTLPAVVPSTPKKRPRSTKTSKSTRKRRNG